MDRFLAFLNNISPARFLLLGGTMAAVIAFFVFAGGRMSQPDMGLLYRDLEIAESGRIVEQLDTLGVPYRLENGGSTILAPRDQINQLRVAMAGEGLGGNVVGYEIFDRGDSLGATSFVNNINKLRAIEGELARTIREINSVQSARVHIVMPERQLFSREEREPSASIILRTSSAGLGSGQVAAIQYLVAAAIPGLKPTAISIVDQNGMLLARGGEEGENAMVSSLDERRRAMETRLRNQIESLLERTVGVGRVRAEVSVDLDMTRQTTNSEVYDPDAQVVLNSNTTEQTSQDTENEPETVTVANNLPEAEAAAGANEPQRLQTSSSTSETINYQNSRTVSTQVKEMGEVERVTVAVLVDGRYTAGDGENAEAVYQPRPESELEALTSLVQNAIGYDANRGDTVEVVNLQFAEPEYEQLPEVEQGFLDSLGSEALRMIETLALLIVSILVLLLVVRPFVMKLIASIPEPAPAGAGAGSNQLESQYQAAPALAGPDDDSITAELAARAASGDEEALTKFRQAKQEGKLPGKPLGIEAEIDVAQVEGRVQVSAVKKMGDIIKSHPDEAAAVVRTWLYSE